MGLLIIVIIIMLFGDFEKRNILRVMRDKVSEVGSSFRVVLILNNGGYCGSWGCN